MKQLLILIVLLSALTFSQEYTVTLDEAVDLGLSRSTLLHTSILKNVQAIARIDQSRAGFFPSLKFLAGYTRYSNIDPFSISFPTMPHPLTIAPNLPNAYMLKLSLQQPIFTGFKISSSYDANEYLFNSSKYDLGKDRSELVLNIKSAYWSLLKAIKLAEAFNNNVEQIKAHLELSNNLLQQGLAVKNDVLKVQTQLSDAKIKLIDAKNNIRLAEINLNNLINMPLSSRPIIDTTISDKLESLPTLETALETAKSRRNELKSIDEKIKANEKLLTIAKANIYPQIMLNANYTYANPNQRIFPMKDEFKGTWDVGVSLQWDVWDWNLTNAKVDEANAQIAQTKDLRKLTNDQITLEVTQVWLNVNLAQNKIEASIENIQQADENYRLVFDKMREGLALNSDLLDAETLLLNAKINYIQSLADYNINWAKLKRAMDNEVWKPKILPD